MEIGVAVTIALALVTGLFTLAHTNYARFTRLASKAAPVIGCIAIFGIGVACGGAVAAWGFTKGEIFALGALVSGTACATMFLLQFLEWLYGDAEK